MIAWDDLVNSLIEGIGGAMAWWSVVAIYRDKSFKGVAWQSQAWGLIWSCWHLCFYANRMLPFSFAGELIGWSAIASWLVLAWRYRRA